MKNKKRAGQYTLQHTGRPFAPSERIEGRDWQDLSYHASEDAARKAEMRNCAHLEWGFWDDHYRVLSPSGDVLPYEPWFARYCDGR